MATVIYPMRVTVNWSGCPTENGDFSEGGGTSVHRLKMPRSPRLAHKATAMQASLNQIVSFNKIT